MKKYIFITLLISNFLFSAYVGNPSLPAIFKKGFFFKNNYLNLRFGYLYDYIYNGKYKDIIVTSESIPSSFSLKTKGGIITLNLLNRIDVFSILGNSRMEFKTNLSTLISTENAFSWCVGTKLLFFKHNNFNCALDGKYFFTKQSCDHFIVEKRIFPILDNFYFLYKEFQGSLGFSCTTEKIIPYVAVTYLYSKIEPYPIKKGLIRYPYPFQNTLGDFTASDSKNRKELGVALGSSIASGNFLINIEGRMFHQNAVNFSCEMKF